MLNNNESIYRRLNKYELASKLEKSGIYNVALAIYKECLSEDSGESGELCFKCGWCIENIDELDNNEAIKYYMIAGENASNPVCRMNSYFRIGWILMHLNENAYAIDAYSKSVQTGHSEGIYNSVYSEALYWCAVCLERENRFIDAIELYRTVSLLTEKLKPESLFREIYCNIFIGRYNKALHLCRNFNSDPPEDFPLERYSKLFNLVIAEKTNLETICFG